MKALWLCAALVAATFTQPAAHAANVSDPVVIASYTGKAGGARIGLSLVVRGDEVLPGSHYFRSSDLVDLPLLGSLGAKPQLKDAQGGVFKLEFSGPSRDGHAPTSLDDSTGLTGTLTDDSGKHMMVTLSLTSIRQASKSPERWYEDITHKSDTAFEQHVQGFYKAVLADDPQEAARHVAFPMRVNAGRTGMTITSPAQLKAKWAKIFTKAWLESAQEAMPHDLSVLQGRAMLGDGLAYFSDAGAVVVNVR